MAEPEGVIYLLHFDRPFKHARHYLGWTIDLQARLLEHQSRNSHKCALTAALHKHGIGWKLVRVWQGTRGRERQLKKQGSGGRQCPICKPPKRLKQPELPLLLTPSQTSLLSSQPAEVSRAETLQDKFRAALQVVARRSVSDLTLSDKWQVAVYLVVQTLDSWDPSTQRFLLEARNLEPLVKAAELHGEAMNLDGLPVPEGQVGLWELFVSELALPLRKRDYRAAKLQALIGR